MLSLILKFCYLFLKQQKNESFDHKFKERMCFFTMQGEHLGSLKIVADLISTNNSCLTCFPDPSQLGFLNKELFCLNLTPKFKTYLPLLL